MRKAYITPAVGLAGPVVLQTQSGVTMGNELAQPLVKFMMVQS
jgi:hypothetical protein